MMFYESHQSHQNHLLDQQFRTNLIFPLHLHHSFEFFYVETGHVDLQVGNKVFPVRSGEAALILPNQPHSYNTPEYAISYTCIFACDYILDFYRFTRGQEAACPVFSFKNTSSIATLVAPNLNQYQIKAALYYIVGEFLAHCPLHESEGANYELLEKSILYVQEHFQESITLRTLAVELGFHYNYLSQFLNKHLNMHFSDFLNRYRIEYACERLKQTNLSMAEISSECGFETLRSFNQNFRKITGQTPSQYRSLFADQLSLTSTAIDTSYFDNSLLAPP